MKSIMKILPKEADFQSSEGETLRELFAVAILRSLTPMERNQVLRRVAAEDEVR